MISDLIHGKFFLGKMWMGDGHRWREPGGVLEEFLLAICWSVSRDPIS
jgi:hypothetical protein